MNHRHNNEDKGTEPCGFLVCKDEHTLWYDEFQAYCQDRGLGWRLHSSSGHDVETYDDMTSEKFTNLKTTGEDKDEDDVKKAEKWIKDSSIIAGALRRACRGNPLARNAVKRALKEDSTDGVRAFKALYHK